MEQGTDEWRAWRMKGIGSSDAAVIMGCCPYRKPMDLYLDKIGEGKPIKMNPAMELGQKFEGAARALFYFEFGFDVDPVELIHPDYNFIRASLDGINYDEKIFVEIKYIGAKKFFDIKDTGNIPIHHFVQMSHQFLVAGLNRAYYVPYILTKDRKTIDQIQFIEIKADENYIKNEILQREVEFWNLIESRTPPE